MKMNPKGNTHLRVAKRRNIKRKDNAGRVIDALRRCKWGMLQLCGYTTERVFTIKDIALYTGIDEHNLERNRQKIFAPARRLKYFTLVEVRTAVGAVEAYRPTDELMSLSLNDAKHNHWESEK